MSGSGGGRPGNGASYPKGRQGSNRETPPVASTGVGMKEAIDKLAQAINDYEHGSDERTLEQDAHNLDMAAHEVIRAYSQTLPQRLSKGDECVEIPESRLLPIETRQRSQETGPDVDAGTGQRLGYSPGQAPVSERSLVTLTDEGESGKPDTEEPFTMSQYVSRDALHAAMKERIRELEAEVESLKTKLYEALRQKE